MCVLLGAVINIMVAWGIVYRSEFNQEIDYDDGDYHELAKNSAFRRAAYPVPPGMPFPTDEEFDDMTDADYDAWIPPPIRRHYGHVRGTGYSRLEFLERMEVEPYVFEIYEGSRVGWPLFSLRADRYSWHELDHEGEYVVTGGVSYDAQGFGAGIEASALPEWARALAIAKTPMPPGNTGGFRAPYHDTFYWRRIPVRPIPLGFVANSLVHSVPFFALAILLPASRRSVRRKRGLCTRCKYDRAGLPDDAPCPECETPA